MLSLKDFPASKKDRTQSFRLGYSCQGTIISVKERNQKVYVSEDRNEHFHNTRKEHVCWHGEANIKMRIRAEKPVKEILSVLCN